MIPSSSGAAPSGAAPRRLIRHRKEVNAMLRRLQELLSSRNPELEQPQFNGQLLDQNREDVYTLMHQQMSSMR